MQAARAYTRKPGAKFIRKREESEQQRFFTWFKRQFPGVTIFSDFGAGLYMSDNERIRMVGMRSRDGMPDIYIDEPQTHIVNGQEITYHGARFEFKKTGTAIYKKDGKTLRKQPYTRRFFRFGREIVQKGDHLQEQAMTLMDYNKKGYYARFVVGVEEAQRHANWYMNVPKQISLDDNLEF
jgi:hypothetical protein